MSTISFSKFHGFGNDYIVIEKTNIPPGVSSRQLAIEICNRNTGAGSDGIAVLDRLIGQDADFSCEIINPDGSIAGFSGNGTRCAVAYLHCKNIWDDDDLRLKTLSGVKNYHLIERRELSEFWFDAEIGKPAFASGEIPVLTIPSRAAVVNEPIVIDGKTHGFSAVNVGNPVACIFVETFNFDWRSIGRSMEVHPKFPERVNVVFVRFMDHENIELRIWERGAGETSSSGTCSAAAAVLSAFMLKTNREVHVHSPGGMTKVIWRDDDEIVLTGRADLAYNGEWPIKA